MSVPTIPDRPPHDLDVDRSTDDVTARLDRLEQEIDRGNREGRRAGRSFAIFATMALAIALVNLIVIAAKLDSSSSTQPAARSSSAAAAGTTSSGSAAAPAPAHRIGVSLREYSIATTAPVGAAGRVRFDVRNAGTMPHEFVVLRTPKPAGSLLKGAEADETGNVGETGDLEPGQSKTVALNLKPGHYALICNLPGHYKAGQHLDFTVR